MASDPTKPLLRLNPGQSQARLPGRRAVVPRPEPYATADQEQRFGPRFRRLAEVLARDPAALELRADAAALAPERLLVFEVRGSITTFAKAISRVPGLELVDEEELPSDQDSAPVAYLLVPDTRALRQIESLWRIWLTGRDLPDGYTPWRDVFACLRDLRPWGPDDRVQPLDASVLGEEIFGKADDELVPLEVEIVFRPNAEAAATNEASVIRAIIAYRGTIVSRVRLDDIAYHAILARLPVAAIRTIIERSPASLAGIEQVMHIRPQSVVTEIDVSDVVPLTPLAPPPAIVNDPILAVLDGVPMAGHPLLRTHLNIEDLFGLEPTALVAQRVHGSAMASLIVHGDRNRPEPPLPRQIHCIPVLGSADRFPSDRLIVDLIYQAVMRMRGPQEPSAPHVIIVNISLGNARRRFHGQLSPWARLLDRLAYRFGILFLVSAGNITEEFPVRGFATGRDFEDVQEDARARAVLRALADIQGDRRLLSPAETVNGLTIGGRNIDWVPHAERAFARANVNPYSAMDTANPSSALGPGFADAVKPDILLPGAREHLRVVRSGGEIIVAPARASRGAGLKVAAPPAQPGIEGAEAYTNGTSAAAALASRTAHRIHDALEAEYGQEFLRLDNTQRAALLKALLVHPARWPDATATFLKELLGPFGRGQAPRQKDNIRRFIGYGAFDPDDAVACAADRATFWAVGSLANERSVDVSVPIPAAIGGRAQPHFISATLAWLTPVQPGRRAYRAVRMKLLDPVDISNLGVTAHGNQPDGNQTNRGTVYTRCWSGERAAVVTANMVLPLRVQRDPDPGATVDELVPFGLAVTVAMPGQIALYEEIRARVRPAPVRP
ncbi:S8 family serine peptidase [Mesorhizobium sp. LHD-90]|uniref:S8 family serine peptidase n=1 Tax=Mesorhizobium sp. LHD-90 TaxID=3071414 RepID=UPI0027E0941C|nr:S8 family serine peptidase [Mesorhizobium sp. LHD-90]MDQ6438078.1 S8 family serine peptidase [Mesorhizobium sp. LHD-90]